MRPFSARAGAAGLLALCLASPLAAESRLELSPSSAESLMRDFWSLVSDVSTRVGLQNRGSAAGRSPGNPAGRPHHRPE